MQSFSYGLGGSWKPQMLSGLFDKLADCLRSFLVLNGGVFGMKKEIHVRKMCFSLGQFPSGV
jgi:hypothetical protein